jgi:hypothetical protein
MKKNKSFFKVGVAAVALVALQACTNLDEKVYNQVLDTQFGNDEEQLNALIGPLYGSLGDYYGQFTGLNAVTDEQIVPTRGGDWKDGDQWKRYEMHTWNAALDDGAFNGLWTWAYNNVGSINQQMLNPTIKASEKTFSELRTLRAFYHYLMLDNFGKAIIAVEKGNTLATEGSALPPQATKKQMFDFVEKEIKESLPNLSTANGGDNYGRMNAWVAHMILAKLYLNHKTYLDAENPAIYQKAWDEANTIITTGPFVLAADFFSNFTINNEGSPETILATPMDKTKRTGLSVQFAYLHYKHQLTYDLGGQPWNGYSAATEFYNSFEDGDVRKNMWIVGQQYDIGGAPMTDDALPMIINPVIDKFEYPAGADGRLRGARSQKYQIQIHNHTSGNSQDNDFVIYRLADVYLMRGEASFRLGQKADAADDFNVIRTARGATLTPFDASLTEADMLAERGREMAWEFHRRQDQIRFGTFDDAYGVKPADGDNHTYFFPIPQSQINLNPNLKPNDGY